MSINIMATDTAVAAADANALRAQSALSRSALNNGSDLFPERFVASIAQT